MDDKISLVDHIINSVHAHNISSCQKESWWVGSGSVYSSEGEGWRVFFRRGGFLYQKKLVIVWRDDPITRRSYKIPITQDEIDRLWEIQSEFDRIINKRSEASNVDYIKIIERLKRWP